MYKMGDNYNSEDRTPAFNMGLATLEWINNLLTSLASHNVEGNIIGMRNTILEVYKEANVYMKDPEKKDAEERWLEIEAQKINNVDSSSIKYSADLLLLINDFDFWLRNLLHKKGILMPKGDDPRTVMTRTKSY